MGIYYLIFSCSNAVWKIPISFSHVQTIYGKSFNEKNSWHLNNSRIIYLKFSDMIKKLSFLFRPWTKLFNTFRVMNAQYGLSELWTHNSDFQSYEHTTRDFRVMNTQLGISELWIHNSGFQSYEHTTQAFRVMNTQLGLSEFWTQNSGFQSYEYTIRAFRVMITQHGLSEL